MKRRINNFHKSKPIVQNVKTDSVNEGKAPKNLTLANDVSDWNPGVSHEQVTEAKGDAPADSFMDAVGGKDSKGQGGGAAAPTSYSEAVNRFLVIRGAQARFKDSAQKWTEARERWISITDEMSALSKEGRELSNQYEDYQNQIANIQNAIDTATAKGNTKEIEASTEKLNTVTDANQEMVANYMAINAKGEALSSELASASNQMDKAREVGTVDMTTLKNYDGDLPDIDLDMRDPRDSEPEDPIVKDPVKGEPEDPIVKDPVKGEPVKGEPDEAFYDDQIPTETIQKALDDSEPARREQEAELQNPEKELLPRDAKTVVREFQPEDDLHEAVKAGGIGLDIIADGGQVEKKVQYWNFHECNSSPQVNYYTLVNLDANSYPSVWEDSLGDTYVRDSITESPMIGASDGTGLLYSGTYTGPSGVTCL